MTIIFFLSVFSLQLLCPFLWISSRGITSWFFSSVFCLIVWFIPSVSLIVSMSHLLFRISVALKRIIWTHRKIRRMIQRTLNTLIQIHQRLALGHICIVIFFPLSLSRCIYMYAHILLGWPKKSSFGFFLSILRKYLNERFG